MSELQPAPEQHLSARIASILDEARSRVARSILDAALASLSAEALREVVHQVLLELDDRAHARVVSSLIARAAHNGSGWAPAAVSDDQVAEVLAFVKAAERIGQADPSEVDEYLGRGTAAFLCKDYASTHRIFGALLPPIGEGNIDLGQHELVDEVLGADVAECAAQYVERAWRARPNMPRLLRWLGASNSKATLKKRIAEALKVCPKDAARQRALLELAGVDRISDAAARSVVLAAMKKAAESRTAGVTGQKRRRHHGHAAELVATCSACDGSGDTARWAAALKTEYRRFPAFREGLERAIGAS